MYIIASLFFIVGIAAGAGYGFMAEKSAMDMVIFIVAGGFAGSAAGGLVFTFLYFTGQNEDEKDEDEKNIDEQIHEKQLQSISTANSSMKMLPEILPGKSSSAINLSSEDEHDTFPDSPPKPGSIISTPDSIISTKNNISADTEINAPAEISNGKDKLRKKLLNKLKLSQFTMPELKLKRKTSTEKLESKPAGVEPKKQETDRQKIKRLKKEIKELKKTNNRKKQAY